MELKKSQINKLQINLKKIALPLLCLLLAFSVFGCGSDSENKADAQADSNQNAESETSAVAEVDNMQIVAENNEIQNVTAKKGNVRCDVVCYNFNGKEQTGYTVYYVPLENDYGVMMVGEDGWDNYYAKGGKVYTYSKGAVVERSVDEEAYNNYHMKSTVDFDETEKITAQQAAADTLTVTTETPWNEEMTAAYGQTADALKTVYKLDKNYIAVKIEVYLMKGGKDELFFEKSFTFGDSVSVPSTYSIVKER